jgi:uncharacterized protein YbbC (DUF1343 family)
VLDVVFQNGRFLVPVDGPESEPSARTIVSIRKVVHQEFKRELSEMYTEGDRIDAGFAMLRKLSSVMTAIDEGYYIEDDEDDDDDDDDEEDEEDKDKERKLGEEDKKDVEDDEV